MFGYIRIEKPELKVKEYDLYKAVYCSLCRQLGKVYGPFSRFTLSYDFTFLALLNMSLLPECSGFKSGRCTFNPIKKCNYCSDTSSLDMPAAAAMIMLYYKILDNIADEKGLKRIGYICIKPIFKKAFKKASAAFPNLREIISEYIKKQSELEREGCRELDRAADPTAVALSQIFELCSDDISQKRVLNRLGYCIGRYIYILDAASDLGEDIKKNSYNVFRFERTESLDADVSQVAIPRLYFCVNEAAKAFELLNIEKYKSILGNIIYLGLEKTFLKELNK